MQNIFDSVFRYFVRKPATKLINLAGLAIRLAPGFALLTASWQSRSAATRNPV